MNIFSVHQCLFNPVCSHKCPFPRVLSILTALINTLQWNPDKAVLWNLARSHNTELDAELPKRDKHNRCVHTKASVSQCRHVLILVHQNISSVKLYFKQCSSNNQ